MMHSKIFIKLLSTIALLVVSIPTLSKSLFQDTSLSLLRGYNYELGDDTRSVATFEYVNNATWGDYFMFIDRAWSADGSNNTYMELAPRFKLMEFENSLIKSVLIAGTWENGETAENVLLGPAIDLNIEGFRFLKLNFYYRDNETFDSNYQFTPVWAIPFTLGDESWLYDGFIDWSSATPQKSSSLHFTSQLKWNIKSHLGTTSNVFVGFEYTYWHNKFGVEGVNENNLNLLFKYHF